MFEPPRTKLVVPAWHCALCFAVLGPNAAGCVGELVPCTEGGRGDPDHPSPALADPLALKDGSTCPYQW